MFCVSPLLCGSHSEAVPPPSLILCVPVTLACIAITFIAVYWDESIALGGENPIKGIGWATAGLEAIEFGAYCGFSSLRSPK